MNWSFAVYDTISGVRQGPMVPTSNSMKRLLNSTGSGTTKVPITGPMTKAQWWEFTQPWARTIAKFRNGQVTHAQLITKREWSESDQSIILTHIDIRGLFARRTTFGTNGYSGDLSINNNLPLINRALAQMIAFLVWASTEGPTPNYDLPIYIAEGKITNALVHSLPTGGGHDRTWWDYQVVFVDDAIEEISSDDGGPDVYFEPRISADGNLEYLLRSGNLTLPPVDWPMSTEDPGLTDVKWVEDATEQANVVYSVGKGSEQLMRVATAHVNPGIPALERAESYKEIEDMGVLQSHANANLTMYNQPTIQFDASMLASRGYENMRLGTVHRLSYQGHAWYPDGWTATRQIGDETDLTETVKLTFQPTGGD